MPLHPVSQLELHISLGVMEKPSLTSQIQETMFSGASLMMLNAKFDWMSVGEKK